MAKSKRLPKWELAPWIKLDNAAKIYPPSRTRDWTAMFRLSATLTEKVDPAVLERALAAALKRMPAFSCRLRRGLFWYYFERMDGAPPLQQDVANPMVRMNLSENGRFMFRVRCYNCRVAVEYFHAVTDGTGGMSFLLTLMAEYLKLKYRARIPAGGLVLDCRDAPSAEESEDSFLVHARKMGASRREQSAYHLPGDAGEPNFVSITTGVVSAEALKKKAREHGTSVTQFITAVLLDAFQQQQFQDPRRRVRRRPVKIQIPVNLRPMYGSKTLRNFASYVNVGINSASGRYSFDEIVNTVKHTMGLEVTEKGMNGRLSANVNAEKNPFVRMLPLFLKAPLMKAVFSMVGDRYNTTVLSNLGMIKLPGEMSRYVTRLDFQLGMPTMNPVLCACVGCGDSVCINFSRRTRDPVVERIFFTTLVKMGVPVRIESNRR